MLHNSFDLLGVVEEQVAGVVVLDRFAALHVSFELLDLIAFLPAFKR